MTELLKAFVVTVRGLDGLSYYAGRKPADAKAAAWRVLRDVWPGLGWTDIRAHRAPGLDGYTSGKQPGERILSGSVLPGAAGEISHLTYSLT